MKSIFYKLKISGIATALPKSVFNFSDLAKVYGENEVKRIIHGTGIKSIHLAGSCQKTSELCFAAASNLLERMQVSPSDVDAIVFISQTHDAVMPATSVMLQSRLGLSTDAVAFDISYGCSGYIYGLYQAAMLLSSGGCSRVLLCAGDILSSLIDSNDKHIRMVFGDGCSATLIEKGEDNFSFIIKSDGSGQDILFANKTNEKINSKIQMNGAAVFEFALREVPLIINELLTMNEWQKNDVGCYVLHQANAFMVNYLCKKMQLNSETVPIAVENVGNTSSASIPMTLSLTHEKFRANSGLNKVVMCGFGVGLSWGAVGLNLSNSIILPPIHI